MKLAEDWGLYYIVRRLKKVPDVRRFLNLDELEIAAMDGELKVVDWLLEHEDFCEDTDAQLTALKSAVQWGHLKVVDSLLGISEVSCHVEEDGEFFEGVLSDAVAFGHLAVVKRLMDYSLAAGELRVDVFFKWRCAVEHGHKNIADWLLTIDKTSIRVLYSRLVANISKYGVVARLLKDREIFDCIAIYHTAILSAAARGGNIDVVNRLLDFPEVRGHVAANDNDALRDAAKFGHIAVVNRLLEIDEVVANAAADNNKALRSAALGGNIDVVNRLLEIPAVVANAGARDNEALRALWLVILLLLECC